MVSLSLLVFGNYVDGFTEYCEVLGNRLMVLLSRLLFFVFV